ncbi:MetS family NSS transporter small subunit [candidate division KSB1 bacterium]|nr:MetS family NSS transporter small subunit [candidate division KSB1 bacterium]
MPLSAWLMMTFGCLILYGGLAICLVIAMKNRPTDFIKK